MTTMVFHRKQIQIIFLVIIHGSLSVSSDSLCVPGFKCVHGTCTSGTTCKCDDGWTGVICDKEVTSPTTDSTAIGDTGPSVTESDSLSVSPRKITTPGSTQGNENSGIGAAGAMTGGTERKKECFPGYRCEHGVCSMSGSGCQCDAGWTGPLCAMQIPDTTTMANGAHTTSITPQTSIGYTSIWKPMEGYGPLADISVRLCAYGFECRYGNCSRSSDYAISCKCEPKWVGVFCNEPCSLNCGPHGQCETNGNNQRCLCDVRYSGKDCSILIMPSKSTPNNGNGDGEGVERKKECRCVHGECKNGLECQCDAGWTGPLCGKQVLNTTTSANGASTTSLSPNTNIPYKSFWGPEKGYGPLADLSIRLCVRGFECRYGNCTCQPCSIDTALSCKCEHNWIGTFCQFQCPVNCGPNGNCRMDEKNVTKHWCECNPLYEGSNCSRFRPQDEIDDDNVAYVYAISVSVSMVVVLVILLTVVPYLLWRRGNISMLKLVFWFQSVEEDDGRLYDAFVSYASTEEDRQFVMECLIPVLEDQMSFSLCIHERDFMPGKYITCNIMESVRQSRRTLFVISPAFVSRNWCKFEFQMAVAEMIEKKHRILPVMMGDMQQIKEESDMNETFQRVINTVTYLQYPGEGASEEDFNRFWKRLQLSMPKKTSPPSPSSVPCSPVQTPTSITPLSLKIPPQHPHKSNGIIFPKSSYKINNFDDINIESSPSLNHTYATENKPARSDRGGLVAWFRNLIRRKKKSTGNSVQTPKYCSSDSPSNVISNNVCHFKDSQEFQHCANNGSESQSNEMLNFKDKGERGLKPLQIELSGWTWPTSDTAQETC